VLAFQLPPFLPDYEAARKYRVIIYDNDQLCYLAGFLSNNSCDCPSHKLSIYFEPFDNGSRTLVAVLYLFNCYALHWSSALSQSENLARDSHFRVPRFCSVFSWQLFHQLLHKLPNQVEVFSGHRLEEL